MNEHIKNWVVLCVRQSVSEGDRSTERKGVREVEWLCWSRTLTPTRSLRKKSQNHLKTPIILRMFYGYLNCFTNLEEKGFRNLTFRGKKFAELVM